MANGRETIQTQRPNEGEGEHVIAVDWGTTNFRAYRLNTTGEIVDRRESPLGLLRVPPGQFQDVLREQVSGWLAEGERTLVLCGMAGSRNGWVEVPYVPCPASIPALAQGMVQVLFHGAQAWIVPGVRSNTGEGFPEIMRGEETAIFGALAQRGAFAQGSADGIICLPGSHSKWAVVADGMLESFRTCVTGEAFAALGQHTILAQFIQQDAPHDDAAFQRGVEHSAHSGGLLHLLFHARTLPLTGQLEPASTVSFLSGLLIGSEVRAMLPPHAPILLLGSNTLCHLYATAIQLCGGTSTFGGADTAASGMFLLAETKLSTEVRP